MSRKPAQFENHSTSYVKARELGCFRAVVTHVTDGDTLDVFVDLGLGKYAYETIRVLDVNTAEIFRPENDLEKAHGLAAKDFVESLLLGSPVLLRTYKDKETFGRYVAEVLYVDSSGNYQSLGEQLIEGGFEKRESYL